MADDGHVAQARRPLVIALAITAMFLVVEVAGGVLTGSLALLADAQAFRGCSIDTPEGMAACQMPAGATGD